jgi:FKBP-type peptidyl-prolyl cis-trans isomerase FkpA
VRVRRCDAHDAVEECPVRVSAVRRLAILLTSSVAIVALAGCSKPPTTPSPVTTYSQTDLVLGTGTVAATGNTLTVNYTGWLYDPSKVDFKGLQFDSTASKGTTFSFPLGAKQVIAGWEKGLPGMQVGGVRRLIVPPSLAYGDTRNGPIPPNATLVFEIELVDVQ